MAHAVHTRDLGRSRSWHKATVRSLAQALLKRERIRTTRAKAKEAQRLTERLITLGKEGSLSARRQAISILNDVDLVGRLFSEIAPRFKSRRGGYTRILRHGTRAGDAAVMAWIELVELEAPPAPKPKGKVREEKAQKPEAKEPAAPPQKERPEPAKQQQPLPKPPEEKSPKNFLGGLRKFFKRRDNP